MWKSLKKVELIIHAGDYTSKNLLDQLRELGDFKGVHGNTDPDKIKRELLDKEVFEVGYFSR